MPRKAKIEENEELKDYNVSQSVITSNKKLRSMLKFHDDKFFLQFYEKELPYIFLPFTERIDDEKRNEILRSESNTSNLWIPDKKSKSFVLSDEEFGLRPDPYHDEGADAQYLTMSPESFLIISKPNIGETELAEKLAKYWKCVLITPEILLQQEIMSGSKVGKCIEFNLKMGRAIGPEVILKLASRRVQSATVLHRGFVMSGFPMIPNKNYSDDPLSSESAVFTAQEIFEELPVGYNFDKQDSPSTKKGSRVSYTNQEEESDEEGEEEDKKPQKRSKKSILKSKKSEQTEDIDYGPEKRIIKKTVSFDILSNVDNQMEFLLNLCPHRSVYIYLLCSNLDVLNKVENLRFDLSSEQEVILNKDNVDIFNYDMPTEMVLVNEEVDSIDYKTMMKLPVHTNKSVSDQLKLFKHTLQPIIDKKMVSNDIRKFIKIDGRLSSVKMFNNLRMRLKTFGFQPVLIPEKFSLTDEIAGEFAGEEDPNENLTLEQAFKKFRNMNTVGSMFKWQLSDWGYKCPVALKTGIIKNGTTERAVKFMNKIFFLSDDEAQLNFCRNPRPYLIPYSVAPSGRILIFGPDLSGKTAVAKCLSYVFQYHLIDPKQLQEEFKEDRRQEFIEKVRTAAITEGMIKLIKIREKQRQKKINLWLRNTQLILRTEFPDLVPHGSKLYHRMEEESKESSDHSIGSDHTASDLSVTSNLSNRTHSELLAELAYYNLPVTDPDQIKFLLEEPEKLSEYIPSELNDPVEPPTLSDPFISYYVEDVLDKTTIPDEELTKEEIIEIYRTAIESAEMEWHDKGKWIFDGFPPDLDILKRLDKLPDDIICLREEDPDHLFLLEKFTKRSSSTDKKDFREFFGKLKHFSIAEKFPSLVHTPSSTLHKSHSAKFNQSKMYLSTIRLLETDAEEYVRTEEDDEYAQGLDEFEDKWAEVKEYLTNNLCDPPIEIDVTDKTVPELYLESRLRIEDKYRRVASVVSQEDKKQETKDFGGDFEIAGEGGGEEQFSYDFFMENRRFGDTNTYCPVALEDYHVLWRGKENYTAEFGDKLYLLSNEEALNAFVTNPRKYLPNQIIDHIPPIRICIAGPIGAAKTKIAKQIANNFGLHYFHFERLVLDFLDLNETERIDDILILQKDLTEEQLLHIDEINMIKRYLEGQDSLPDYLMESVFSLIWFSDHFKETGFVLAGFPKNPDDVKYMAAHYLIPDVVIELSASLETCHNRVYHTKIDLWQENIDNQKNLKEMENQIVMQKWSADFEERTRVLLEELREERRHDYFLSQPPVPPYSSPTESFAALHEEAGPLPEEDEIELDTFVYDPQQQEEDTELIKLRVAEELPKPEFNDIWESVEEAADRIETVIAQIYNRDVELMNNVKMELKDENINCVNFDTNKAPDNVFFEILNYTDKFKYRDSSIFERVYSVTIDVAEKLLEQGYYYISKFGRSCPVQIFEKVNPVQMFLPAEHKMIIFPTIHRRYIYFICGADHLEKFKKNPLVYTKNEYFILPLLPLKVAIIGPPKCGKSTLADRFDKEFGLKVITRGKAIRYVLRQLANSELARNIKKALHKGWSVTFDMIANAVEAMTLDGKSITQGYVLDGFPTTLSEMKHLRELGIIPYVILNINATEDQIKEYSKRDALEKNRIPVLSYNFVKNRYEHWKIEKDDVHIWLDKTYQNLYQIPPGRNKWCAWNYAKDFTITNFFNILENFVKRHHDTALKMRSMLVTPYEFERKQSNYLHYCPCCLFKNNHLVNGGLPPDRNGLVLYRDFIYWICEEHYDAFLEMPYYYLPPHNEILLPSSLPERTDIFVPDIYMGGLCIVTFWHNWPRRVLIYGRPDLSVLYRGNLYVFCEEECMNKFMREPYLYFHKVIHFRNLIFPLEMPISLPVLGYLEQEVADLVVRAVVNVELIRPFHPCMTIEMSAAICMGMYLKMNNLKNKKLYDFIPFYQEFKSKFDERCQALKEKIFYFKSIDNPFLCLEY